MNLLRHTSFWTPRVLTCSSLERARIDEVWGMVLDYVLEARKQGSFDAQRARQARAWMQRLLQEMLEAKLRSSPAVQRRRPVLEAAVERGETTPYLARSEEHTSELQSRGHLVC